MEKTVLKQKIRAKMFEKYLMRKGISREQLEWAKENVKYFQKTYTADFFDQKYAELEEIAKTNPAAAFKVGSEIIKNAKKDGSLSAAVLSRAFNIGVGNWGDSSSIDLSWICYLPIIVFNPIIFHLFNILEILRIPAAHSGIINISKGASLAFLISHIAYGGIYLLCKYTGFLRDLKDGEYDCTIDLNRGRDYYIDYERYILGTTEGYIFEHRDNFIGSFEKLFDPYLEKAERDKSGDGKEAMEKKYKQLTSEYEEYCETRNELAHEMETIDSALKTFDKFESGKLAKRTIEKYAEVLEMPRSYYEEMKEEKQKELDNLNEENEQMLNEMKTLKEQLEFEELCEENGLTSEKNIEFCDKIKEMKVKYKQDLDDIEKYCKKIQRGELGIKEIKEYCKKIDEGAQENE